MDAENNPRTYSSKSKDSFDKAGKSYQLEEVLHNTFFCLSLALFTIEKNTKLSNLLIYLFEFQVQGREGDKTQCRRKKEFFSLIKPLERAPNEFWTKEGYGEDFLTNPGFGS